jgi:predicted transposase YbfD/YdcC
MVFATWYTKKPQPRRKAASAKYFHEAVWSQCGKENILHWCMDVIFREDKSKKNLKTVLKNFQSLIK